MARREMEPAKPSVELGELSELEIGEWTMHYGLRLFLWDVGL